MKIDIYKPEQQGYGEFDNGAIKEQKPIGFTGDGSAVSRTGPLFYWAWMHAAGAGHIAAHPHQAFEILTYVIAGRGRHLDNLGNDGILEADGVQVMQAGKGIVHEEFTLDEGMEGFQIWFEPNLVVTQFDDPVYRDYDAAQFRNQSEDPAYELRKIAGPGSPVDFLKADGSIQDIRFKSEGNHRLALGSGRYLNVLAVRGDASLTSGSQSHHLAHKDYAVLFAEQDEEVKITASAGTHLILIEVPRNPGYRLYPK